LALGLIIAIHSLPNGLTPVDPVTPLVLLLSRYVELLEKDTIKFGFSSRDYVLLNDKVQVPEEEEPAA